MADSDKYWREAPDRHTQIKSQIVVKYFTAWSRIVRRRRSRLIYLDLFAGRGAHDSGDLSTAMQVIEKASEDPFLCANLIAILNDRKRSHTMNIDAVLSARGLKEKFAKGISIRNFAVDTLTPLYLEDISPGATFCLIDPHGFKGVTLKLIEVVIRNWGCDCVVFFSTSGINRNITLKPSTRHLKDLFTAQHYATVLEKYQQGDESGEMIALNQFRIACQEIGAKYFLPFQMNFDKTDRISHHLIFLSKHWLGFSIMKDVMADYSRKQDFIPLYICRDAEETQCTFGIGGLMDQLEARLTRDFQGCELSVLRICENIHERGLLFTTKNVKDALVKLADEQSILVSAVGGRTRKPGTMGDKCRIRFP